MFIAKAIAFITAALLVLSGLIDLLQSLGCFLSETVLCSLTSVSGGTVGSIGTCFEAAGPCKEDFFAALVKIGIPFAASSPGLQRLKLGPFARTDQPRSQAQV